MHSPDASLAYPNYRPDIDGLRAVAVLAVVLFHTFPELLPGGFIGVDVFFVISGFLISTIIFSSLENDRFSLMEFYVRRIRRIFPALIVVLLASLFIGSLILLPDEYRQLGKHTAASAGFIQNFTLWNESGYFDVDAKTKPLLHLWTLAVEEQFYIIWPLLLVFVWRRRWSFLTITGAIAAGSFAVNIYLTYRDPDAAFFLPVSRFWELMVGGVLAYLKLHRPHLISSYRDGQSFLGFTLIVTGLLVLNEGRQFPGWWALLPTLGTFLLISAGPNTWLNHRLLANKPMIWVGLISYPLYLWHWPLLSYLSIVEDDPSIIAKLVAVGSAIVLSWLTYNIIEKPLRFRGNPRMIAGLLFASSISLVIVGLFISGIPLLQSKEATQSHTNAASEYDYKSAYRHGECFLQGWPNEQFSAICDGRDTSKTTVVLWGDSHAASLYPGLRKQSALLGFNLAQYNVAGCPPILNFDPKAKKTCEALSEVVLGKLRTIKPDTVILAGFWLIYDGKHEFRGNPWGLVSNEKMSSTLSTLKSLGTRNIIVIGQLPTYLRSQKDIGSRTFVQNVNSRTYEEFNFESKLADDRIRDMAIANNVEFISPTEILCNADGCMISTSLEIFTPLAWDRAHLTAEGSEYLIESAVESNLLHLPR